MCLEHGEIIYLVGVTRAYLWHVDCMGNMYMQKLEGDSSALHQHHVKVLNLSFISSIRLVVEASDSGNPPQRTTLPITITVRVSIILSLSFF